MKKKIKFKNNKKKIGIIIDNPSRDLIGALFISNHLKEKNCDVFLINIYRQAFDIFFNKLDVCVFTYCRNNNSIWFLLCKFLSIKTVVLESEGNADSTLISNILNNSNAAKLIDKFLFWGEEQMQIISKKSNLDITKCKVTGVPRLYSYLLEKTVFINNSILFCSNFSFINPRFNSYEREKKSYQSIVNASDDMISNKKKDTFNAFHDFLLTLKFASRNFKNFKIILRIHPFEDDKKYIDFIKNNNLHNIKISDNNSLFDDIYSCNFLIHNYCNSAIEGRLAGVKIINIKYREYKEKILKSSEICSLNAHSVDQLEELILNYDKFANRLNKEDISRLLERRFCLKPGQSNNWPLNVSNEIYYLLYDDLYLSNIFFDLDNLKIISKNFKNLFLQILRFIFGYSKFMFFSNLFLGKRKKIKEKKYNTHDILKNSINYIKKYNLNIRLEINDKPHNRFKSNSLIEVKYLNE